MLSPRVVAAMPLFLAVPAIAASTSIHRSVADTYLQPGGEAKRSHGTCKEVAVDGSPRQVSYIKFDLRKLANRVAHATLTLRCTNPSQDGGTVYVLDDSSWAEGNRCGSKGTGLRWADVDCNADGALDAADSECSTLVPDFGQPVAQFGPVVDGEDASVDLTPVFKTRLPDVHTFVIVSSSRNGADYASREVSRSSRRPRLEIGQLVNDECDAPTVVATTPFEDTLLTMNAGTSDGDPGHGCIFPTTGTNTVWYAFTPPHDGTVTARTFGSAYDTVVSAYTGECNPIDHALTEVACNDNVGARLDSEITFPATANTRYLIMVSDRSGNFPGGAHLRIRIDLN
jgi:hypothetical protein